MRKKYCILFQFLLLVWFFLDMVGVRFGDKWLVTRSYKDDGIFFIIYLATILIFLINERVGQWFIIIWSALWFIVEFLSHEWYTIFNDGFMGSLEGKKRLFGVNISFFNIGDRYIPDAYHIILHILTLCVFISMVIYKKKNKRERIIFK